MVLKAARAWTQPRSLVRRLALAMLVSFALVMPLPASAQQAIDGVAVEESRDRVLGSGDYQIDRPQPREPRDRGEPMELPAWLVEAILWVIAAIVVGMVLVFLFNVLRNRSGLKLNRDRGRQRTELVETPLRKPQSPLDDRTLEEADALAAAGRFAEAIHLLLLVAMDRLRRELGNRVAPALTSREVLDLAPIPETLAAPLTRMVSLSEIKHFGGRDAAATEYRQCRQDFLRFSGSDAAE